MPGTSRVDNRHRLAKASRQAEVPVRLHIIGAELKRKRRKPRRVYFSPSSGAFQYPPPIQDVSLRTMRVLVEAGVEVAFLAKGFVRRPFLELFADHADAVFAQIGITTLDRGI